MPTNHPNMVEFDVSPPQSGMIMKPLYSRCNNSQRAITYAKLGVEAVIK